MSFLAARLARSEKQFFRKDSESKVSELRKKLPSSSPPLQSEGAGPSGDVSTVLPEVLMHSVPLPSGESAPHPPPPSRLEGDIPAGFSAVDTPPPPGSRDPVSTRPGQRSIIAVPQIRLGPAKYQLAFPESSDSAVAPTANERRQVALSGAAARKLRAEQAASLREGLVMVSKAFGIATILVYGGAALGLTLGMRALGVSKVEEIPEKGRQFLEPKVAGIRSWFEPLKDRANSMAQRLRMTEEEQKALGQKYAEVLRAPGKDS